MNIKTNEAPSNSRNAKKFIEFHENQTFTERKKEEKKQDQINVIESVFNQFVVISKIYFNGIRLRR